MTRTMFSDLSICKIWISENKADFKYSSWLTIWVETYLNFFIGPSQHIIFSYRPAHLDKPEWIIMYTSIRAFTEYILKENNVSINFLLGHQLKNIWNIKYYKWILNHTCSNIHVFTVRFLKLIIIQFLLFPIILHNQQNCFFLWIIIIK